jgi:phage-related protein
MKNTDAKTAGEVVQFLSACNGVEVFNWTPPRQAVSQDVICRSWSVAYGELLQDGCLSSSWQQRRFVNNHALRKRRPLKR